MDVATVMKTLEAKGKPSAAKTYARHGVKEPTFGVSYADFGALAKKIGVDHELALALWKTGNHDARVLATMVVDPARMKRDDIERWIADGTNYVIVLATAKVAAGMADAVALARDWIDAPAEYASAAGWTVLTVQVGEGNVAEADARALLARIVQTIHAAANRTRYAMNGALIAIGGYMESLRGEALAAAKKIGKVEVNHGDTDCKTPDAASYIAKMAARAKKRAPSA